MQRVIALLFIGLLAGVFAAAAQAPANSGKTLGGTTALAPITVRGCLGGTPGAFTLTPNGANFAYRLEAEASQLQSHVGQQVEITGRPLNPQTDSGTTSGNRNSDMGVARVLQVQQITLIADHCDPSANGPAATGNSSRNPDLPRSATILPLLGIVGLGSLAASLIMRR